jgi:NAD(P)-dependent dehydrogenase (short-subunit alcohol dehydrogenase family)
MAKAHIHRSHPDIIKRLKRAEGHMRRVIEMFYSGLPRLGACCGRGAHHRSRLVASNEEVVRMLLGSSPAPAIPLAIVAEVSSLLRSNVQRIVGS